MNSLLPYLRPAKNTKGLYNLDLCLLDQETQDPPKITFVSKDKSVCDLEELGIKGSELVKISFENLRKIEIAPADISDGVLLFKASYVSEKILDKSFVKDLEKQLDTNEILISIPARDSMLVCSSHDDGASAILSKKSQLLYQDFTMDALSPLIFKMKDGVIVSAENIAKNLDQLESLKDSFGSFSCNITKSTLFQDLYNFRLLVEAEKIEDLQNGLFYTILDIIKSHNRDKNFNNSIDIVFGESIDKNKENAIKIEALYDKILVKYKSLYPNRVESIKLSFLFSQDFRNGDLHKKIIKHLK